MADSRKSLGSRALGGPSPTRLPSARERRPALAALAVLLIVGGAFASGWLALQAGNRSEYLQVRDGAEIAQGQPITEEDLESVELPEDFDGAISASRLDDLDDLRAVTRLMSGTVLLETMTTSDGSLVEGQQELGLTVQSTPLVNSLVVGDLVAINVVPQEEEDEPKTYVAVLSTLQAPSAEGGIGTGASDVTQLSVVVSAACVGPLNEANAAGPEALAPGRLDSIPGTGADDCTGSGGDGQQASGESG